MSTFLTIYFFISFLSCTSYKPIHAAGKHTEIIVVCREQVYTEIETLLSSSLERIINTPTTEYIFSLNQVTPEKLAQFKYRRNLLIIGLIGEDYVDSVLSSGAIKQAMVGKEYVFGAADLFVSRQALLVIYAPTLEKLKTIIKNNSELLFNYFAEEVRRRLKEVLYNDGYQEDLSNDIKTKYGFSINIPLGWKVVQDDYGFIKLMRRLPDRVISIYWEDDSVNELDKEKTVALRDKIGNQYYDGDQVDISRTNFYWVEFHGLPAGKLEGIWRNDEKVMGGPFRTYFFSTGGRFYVIDLHVFAPGGKKWRWLQQLEIIVDTFSV